MSRLLVSRLISRQYLTFFAVGVGVTAASIAFRAGVGWLIDDGASLVRYLITVVLAYVFGLLVGAPLHKSITFEMDGRVTKSQFARFAGVQVAGMLSTAVVSACLLQLTSGRLISAEAARNLAFAAAAFIVSLQSYALNKRFVFVPAPTKA